MNSLELYEKKIIRDEEFPVQLESHILNRTGSYFELHWHEHLELHYIREGTGHFQLDQQQYPATPGTLIIANSNELHWGFCDTYPYLDQRLVFSVEDISKKLFQMNLLFQNAIAYDPQIDGFMTQIWQEFADKNIGYKQNAKASTTQLLVYLSRNYATQILTPEDSLRRKKTLERLNQVILYIESHYTESITNQQLADLIFLSKDRFEHLFREHIGIAPLQYINELRLKKAMILLKNQDLSITEIATAVGFSDYNHFGRLFRKYYGCAPKDAKNNYP